MYKNAFDIFNSTYTPKTEKFHYTIKIKIEKKYARLHGFLFFIGKNFIESKVESMTQPAKAVEK